jgi:uncharacterized phiE125 gp8 family phage protein
LAEPVSLTEAKQQTRMVDDDSEDTFITSLIAPARAYVERVSRFLFVGGERTETFWRWGDYLEIWRQPITSIDTIAYSTTADPVDDVEYTGFVVNSGFPTRISPALDGIGFPELIDGGTITVTYTAGALATTDEAYLIGKRAILLLIGHWFDIRGTAAVGTISSEIEFAVTELLNTIKPLSAY